jgi:hypothetical protein
MSRTLRSLVILAMLTALIADCSSQSGGTGSGGGPSTATTHAKAVRFAECMRANGVSAFPDPDASGELTIDGVANGSSVDTSSTVFKRAIGTCKSVEPPGFTGGEVTAQQMSARLAFARCVRRSGVPDFPDPTRDGPLVDTNRIPSAATAGGLTLLNAVMRTCSSFSAAAGVSQP